MYKESQHDLSFIRFAILGGFTISTLINELAEEITVWLTRAGSKFGIVIKSHLSCTAASSISSRPPASLSKARCFV